LNIGLDQPNFKQQFEDPEPETEDVDVHIESFVTEGLGHTSYLVDLGDGTALVVDPARLPTAQRDHAARAGLRVGFTADTHTHADYISGSPELAVAGATFLAPAAAGLAHAHQGVADGELLMLGRYRFEVIATPGHTPDHLAYLLLDDAGPVALFSGGSLMVGTVGRTDLVGDDRREALARDLYRALTERVLVLPDDVAVYPTHGAGSFCSAPGGVERVTTIGKERATNPLLAAGSEDEFVDRLLRGLGSFPEYFRRLPAVNQRGVPAYDAVPALEPLTPDEVVDLVAGGAVVVDARKVTDFAVGHIPGSLSIELRPVFASWLGWLTDLDQPLVFVLDDDQHEAGLVRQALTVGHDNLAGRLVGGLDAWRSAGLPLESIELIEPNDIDRPLLDVRQHNEFTAGHVPGAAHIELGSLPAATEAVPAGPVATLCGKTERAMTAASILQRAGRRDIAVLRGGFTGWTAVAGHQPATDA
jgi:glyoxylase-like metal-dependent hydrolase (beta-lactamase superfamily II)/rhodanese-related sulfurtransferase